MSKENVSVSEMSQNEGTEISKKEVRDVKKELLSKPYLLSKVVGLSASESDDLYKLGLSELHLKDIIIEINRYLLASGASIVYGGDLRASGLTEVLISLVASYSFPNQDQDSRLRSYLAFPISLNLTRSVEAEYVDRIKFHRVEPPDDLAIPDRTAFVPPVGTSNLYIWARSLTKMREEMEESCDARVFIGGRSVNYKGRAPGVLEEILTSCRKGTPMYLVGGFGGAVSSVVDHLEGRNDLMGLLSQIKSSQEYTELRQEYETHKLEDQMTWPEDLLRALEPGWEWISERNGLSVEENKKLAISAHVVEIVYYILKGLAVLSKR